MTKIYKSEEGKRQVISFYENLLKQWQQVSNQHVLATSLGDTFVIESGEENTQVVLLLHGSSSNSGMWVPEFENLAERYHVFAIDIIGECGKSDEIRPLFKGKVYSNWISEILDNLRLDRVSLLACSLGGWIAIDFAIMYPEKTDRLVLLAPAGIVQVKSKTIILIIFTSFLGNWGFRKLNKLVYGGLNVDAKALEFANLINENFKPRTDVLPVFSDDALQKLRVPILYIGGENDCFYNSKKAVDRLDVRLESFQSLLLENTGHALINMSDKILQFLEA